MPSRYSSTGSQSRELFKQLLLMKLMQEMAAQSKAQPQNQSQDKTFLQRMKDIKDAYDTGKDIYSAFKGTSGATTAQTGASAIANGGSAAASPGFASLGEMVGNGLYTPATTGIAQTEAANAAWNSGADAASGVSGSGGASTAGTNYAGILAAGLSAYNDYKKLTSDKLSDEQKAMEGSRAIPRAAAAYFTGGLSTLGEGFARKQWGGTLGKIDKLKSKTDPFMLASRFWTSDKYKTEGNRLKKLTDQGIAVPENLQLPMMLKRGRKKSELVNPNYAADFVGQTKDGFVNNKFANSRNEADLKGQDLTGYSAFFEKFGNDWMKKFNENQRNQIAQTALDNKAVRERHGTMDVTWNPDLEGKISKLTGYKFNQPPATPPIVNKPAPLAPGQANGFTIPRTTNKSANTVRR